MGSGVDVQESERERKGKARNVKDESPLRNPESSDKNIKQPTYYTNNQATNLTENYPAKNYATNNDNVWAMRNYGDVKKPAISDTRHNVSKHNFALLLCLHTVFITYGI